MKILAIYTISTGLFLFIFSFGEIAKAEAETLDHVSFCRSEIFSMLYGEFFMRPENVINLYKTCVSVTGPKDEKSSYSKESILSEREIILTKLCLDDRKMSAFQNLGFNYEYHRLAKVIPRRIGECTAQLSSFIESSQQTDNINQIQRGLVPSSTNAPNADGTKGSTNMENNSALSHLLIIAALEGGFVLHKGDLKLLYETYVVAYPREAKYRHSVDYLDGDTMTKIETCLKIPPESQEKFNLCVEEFLSP